MSAAVEFSQLHGSVAGVIGVIEKCIHRVAPAVSRPASGPVRAAESTGTADPIAVIGLGCRLPVLSVPEYWDNLIQGKNSIEVPKTRWDWELFWDEDKSVPDKTYAKIGGFLGWWLQVHLRTFRIPPERCKAGGYRPADLPWRASARRSRTRATERDESLIEPVWVSSSVTPWAVRSRTTTSCEPGCRLQGDAEESAGFRRAGFLRSGTDPDRLRGRPEGRSSHH